MAELESRKLTKVRNHPGIYRRGNRYVVVYREPDGRQRRKAAKTLSEADALKASIRTDIQRGEYQAPTRTTVQDYFDTLDQDL